MKSVRVDKARLQNRMEAMSAFGATAGGGVTRLALSGLLFLHNNIILLIKRYL